MQTAAAALRTTSTPQALLHDWSPGQNIPTPELWERLGAGHFEIRSAQHTLGRCIVSLRKRPLRGPVASAAAWNVTERVLCGDQSKVIASDLAISCSTVCVYWHSTLAALCEPLVCSKARAFLVVCACSTRTLEPPSARVHGLGERGEVFLSVGLDEGRLRDWGLSRAEREIAEAMILGRDSAEICAERQTSPRTLANQINAIYRKLGVSGRRELMVAVLVPGARPSAACSWGGRNTALGASVA